MNHPSSAAPDTDHIPSVMGLAALAKKAFDGNDLGPIRQSLTARFSPQENADLSVVIGQYAALMDMCLIEQMLGNVKRGIAFQTQAVETCRLYQIPSTKSPARLRVLGFATADIINANTPIEFLVDGSDITLYIVYVVPDKHLPPIPDHDLAIVLVAESEKAMPILKRLEATLADWPRPVLNHPARVPLVGRESLYKLLAPIESITIPATVQVSRNDLLQIAAQETLPHAFLPNTRFPLIVRPVDSHAGLGLEKIDTPCAAAEYLARRTENEFFISPFIDYSNADGYFRKYRIAVFDGKAFPAHMAVSRHWMVHYLNAGMMDSAEKRAEEARFMDRFDLDFGARHGKAIAEITEKLQIDYYGIDCAETADGKLLIFEAGTALVVHNMDQPEIFPYKSRHMQAIFEAFQSFLYREAEKQPDQKSP